VAVGDIDTSAYGPAVNYGNASVEAWRDLITANAGTLPVEFLLAWLGPESNGNPCSWTSRSEAGIAQLDPENATSVGTSTAEQHPVPPCVAGRETTAGFSSLTADQANTQVMGLINYVNWCVAQAQSKLDANGFSIDPSTADFWSFVKMIHVGTGYTDQLLSAALLGNGGVAPSTWADTLAAVASSGSPYAYLATASGVNTASITGQYGAGGGASTIASAITSPFTATIPLSVPEMIFVGVASIVGVAAAAYFTRWLTKGVGEAA
jgi:hypothetical protein